MEEGLTPKQLAAIKREGRKRRISLIRRRVAVSVATLAAAFSGLILARSLTLPATSQSTPTAPANTIANATTPNSTSTSVASSTPTQTPTTTTTPVPVAPTPPPLTTSQS